MQYLTLFVDIRVTYQSGSINSMWHSNQLMEYEFRGCIDILWRTKVDPLIIGEPAGVGKPVIANGYVSSLCFHILF